MRCTVVLGFLLSAVGKVSSQESNQFSGKDCRVDAFPTQGNFDSAAYQGHWYAIAVNRFWFEVPILSTWFRPKDVQVVYTVTDDGNIRIQQESSGFIGFGCSKTEGLALAPNKDFPQKSEVSFPGTILNWFLGAKPYWILHTDYVGFAVVYACWEKQTGGSCKRGKEFVWTLNRSQDGHTPDQWKKIRGIIEDVCVEPDSLRRVEQSGQCNITYVRPPNDEM